MTDSEEKLYLCNVIPDAVRRFMGWCPDGHVLKARSGEGAGPNIGSANPVAKNPGPSGTDRSGKPRELRYEHTQRGFLIIGAVSAAIVLIVAMTVLFGLVWITALVICILIFALAICSTLTASVSDDALWIRFGPLPLIRKSWPVAEIATVTTVTNPWYYGWGIRWTPSGPLYNVSGYGAVEVTLHSGRKVRIGTDEPEVLCRAIEQARTGLKRHRPALP